MESEPPTAPKRRITFSRLIPLVITVLILIGVVGGFFLIRHSSSPVPDNLLRSVNFPVYYPDQNKLPKGYTLNKNSFTSPQKGVILYSVDYGSGNKLVFSAQAQPSDSEIQSFYANYIPLRNQINTTLGQAQIGAYGSGKNLKTVISLPIKGKTWIIVTTPYDINQNQLKQILNSLKN